MKEANELDMIKKWIEKHDEFHNKELEQLRQENDKLKKIINRIEKEVSE